MIQYFQNIRLHGLLWIGIFLLGVTISAIGQENQILSEAGKKEAGLTIYVGVEEVRLDAVVLDRKGRQITDLTAEDFEIRQDGQLQKITSSTYISDNQAQPGMKNGVSPNLKRALPIPAPLLTRDTVHRTIVFLVDDLSMSFPDVYYARMSLQRFVERQMQPGDLISIIQTKGGNAGLQTFSSDKRELLARISNIRWNVSYPIRWDVSDPSGIEQIMLSMSFDPKIAAIDYCIKALLDMPGRKTLLLLSANVMLPNTDPVLYNRIKEKYNALADSALRAGVVIHTLDILGLVNSQAIALYGNVVVRALDAEGTYLHEGLKLGPTPAEQRRLQAEDRKTLEEIPLSHKTGGLFLTGNNFFLNGIGDADELMKGYYLLSYTPPPATFSSDSPKVIHKIKITVKRPGSEVHSRDGFYGTPGILSEPDKTKDPMMEAMMSPFRNSDLKLNLASGYINDPQSGYLVRAWLHLDGNHLSFVDEKDGSHSVSLLAMAITSDVNGLVQDSGQMRIGFPVNDRDIRWIRENGLSVSLFLPAKKPGAYYVRAAVRDQVSGAIGSAYQFMEIPDLKKGGLSLSSIFILNRDEDASWIQSGTAEKPQGPPDSTRQAAKRSQALRKYRPGESFDYMAIIYNAKAEEGLTPDLESQYVLYRNGSEIFKSSPAPVDVRNAKDFRKISVSKKLKLDNTLQPGDYVLQLQVTDKRMRERNLAAQTVDFEVDANPSGLASEDQFGKGAPVEPKTRTLMELTSKELLRLYPIVLGPIKSESSQDQLEEILHRVGDNVLTFFDTFSNTSAKEQVRMFRTLKDTSGFTPVHYFRTEERIEDYHYLILPGSGISEGSWIEDRADKRNQPVKEVPGFMMSSGYAAHSMYLHPNHQSNSLFRYIGRDPGMRRAHVIAFVQKPESRDYLAQIYDPALSATIRFLAQGFAWVDSDTYQILRIYTEMLLPQRETSLKETNADIYYEKVRFDNTSREFWLPKEVRVRLDFPDCRYFNWHKYSDYHLFSVESDYKITLPKVEK